MKEPEIETPHQLFSAPHRYYAPVFQRLYVWGGAELEALLEDIEAETKVVPQFLGAIVLKEIGKAKGPTSPMTYLIIDGQQRLTTIFMVFAAIAEVADQAGFEDIARYIEKEYLSESRSPAFAGQPKLVPTMQDRDCFWNILAGALPDAGWNFSLDRGDGKTATKLAAQWLRVQTRTLEIVYAEKKKIMRRQLENFLEKLQKNLNLIVITLEQEDDANLIFSKLNASGVPLSLADLVRNEVFSKFASSEAKKADRFYDTRWHPFERSFRSVTDLNAFFPIYSYIAFAGSVTKAGAFPELQQRWKFLSPQMILAALEEYSPLYQALISGNSLDSFGKELNGMLNRFSRMPRTTVTWPYILELLHETPKGAAEKRAVKCLEIIESFLVRRALSGVEPTGLHAVFKGLWQHAGSDPEKVKNKIITRTIKVPSDVELDETLNKSAVDTRVILPYVLNELERDLRKKSRYDPITASIATVEHVMPKKRGAAWEVVQAKEYDGLVGLIGNLVPLSDIQNKSLKDDPWSIKRKRLKGSNFFMAQSLAKHREWDGVTIKRRTRQIADWVLQRWPAAD